jgi:subtilisin-like proprotein convertase family protein
MNLGLSDLPPLSAGTYYIGVYDPNPVVQTFILTWTLGLNANGVVPTVYYSGSPVPIFADAVTNSVIFVTNQETIVSIEVGLRADDPRISDMAFTLISPSGDRILLMENRGGDTTNGLGSDLILTNLLTTVSSTNLLAWTNDVPVGTNQGTLVLAYDSLAGTNSLAVYYDNTNILQLELTNGPGSATFNFGPGPSNDVVVIVDAGVAANTNLVWDYSLSMITNVVSYLVFTENTNLTTIPIKFAVPPFNISSTTNSTNVSGNNLYYFPEQSLQTLVGESTYGAWTLEMWDTRAVPTNLMTLDSWYVSFVLENTVSAPVSLTPGVPATNTIPAGDIAIFIVDVPDWALAATNTLVFATAPVNLLFNQDQAPTGVVPPDFTMLSGATNGFYTLTLGSAPPLVPGARYYLGVQNTNTFPVTAAVEVDFDITALTNMVPYTDIINSNSPARYFSYDVSTNATAVAFQLFNLSADLNLVARQGPPVPTAISYDYGSFNPGTNAEEIIVFTNSAPVALRPGRWYLGVLNTYLATSTYTILVTEYTNPVPNIVTLTNAIPYITSNPGPTSTNDYYLYQVSPNAVGVQFEIDNPSASIALVARKGLPLPGIASYDFISASPGTNGELIVIYTNSTPVNLTPGDWFLTAVNVSGGPASYSIMATELAAVGTTIVITNVQVTSTSFCLTWTSVAGLHYFVLGVPNLLNTNWQQVSPEIVATDVLTTYCVPLPSPYHFFRVGQGLLPATVLAPVNITSITRGANGVRLQWTAPPTVAFEVEWTPTLSPPFWAGFTNSVTSASGYFSFLDDGTQTGGFNGTRFYRLLELP